MTMYTIIIVSISEQYHQETNLKLNHLGDAMNVADALINAANSQNRGNWYACIYRGHFEELLAEAKQEDIIRNIWSIKEY